MTFPSQASLFEEMQKSETLDIDGLTYIPDYINTAQSDFLLQHIDASPWLNDLKRRVQHYGYRYDYTARRVTEDAKIGALPEWLDDITDGLCKDGFFTAKPDQAIVNEYLPGQGISAHVDCVPCFGDTILSLSLDSACIIDFTHTASGEKTSLLLEPHSLLILTGDARYQWKHSIAPRKLDRHQGKSLPRKRRVSVTFRSVILAD